MKSSHLAKSGNARWELSTKYADYMRVPARVYATDDLIESMDEAVLEQISRVASLPGIVGAACCMPDGHRGYGFPIGGVAAFDTKDGIISPGGIGFDINCGMRLLRTSLTEDEARPKLRTLVDALFEKIPAGVGRKGNLSLSKSEFSDVISHGAEWALDRGYAWASDLERTEDGGVMKGADPAKVSKRAIERGIGQVGTLGSGNHYVEIQVAREGDVIDPSIAGTYGIDRPNQILIMIHSGSRGFGHQVASDYLKSFLEGMESRFNIPVRDKELSCAPFDSDEGRSYHAAMGCAVNMAFVNRQLIAHWVREVFSDIFGRSAEDLEMEQIYDVTHNTAKVEHHDVDGERRELLVHRKGATRAFGPGDEDVPEAYRSAGQPVIIGGSMETGSYLLAGNGHTPDTFFTTAHGSGRTMGRRAAKRQFRGTEIRKRMESGGIYVRSASESGLAEECGDAYKNIDDVVLAAEEAGLSRRVARLVPIGNIKG